jgi:hypothetical protein
MSNELINLSPDLKRLREEGFEIEVRNGLLLVHQIPYLDHSSVVKRGSLVSELTLAGERTTRPSTHVIYFSGHFPCNPDKTPIEQLRNNDETKQLAEGVVIRHTFSCKPPEGYTDYYHKITLYAGIISAPAKSIDDNLTEKTFIVPTSEDEQTVFNYSDTNSSRAGIQALSAKFKDQKIGIVGVGGTGSYILDFVAKTNVKEIHLFEGDKFLQHNAFRAPGAPTRSVLAQQNNKAQYFQSIYSAMRKGIFIHPEMVTSENVRQLCEMDFVFICLDTNEIKGDIINALITSNVDFVDVGMGIQLADDTLVGIVRVTFCNNENKNHILDRISTGDGTADDYSTNIQIAELNALNAALAVIKWKKLIGFYPDFLGSDNTLFTLSTGMLDQ